MRKTRLFATVAAAALILASIAVATNTQARVAVPMGVATMAAAEPNVTLYQLQKNCEKLAAETFRRETANDEDRVDCRAHYNARLDNQQLAWRVGPKRHHRAHRRCPAVC
jgi:hypothetical protein